MDRIAAIRHYVQGMLMGAADVIPGVSGGTMALILGVYQRLIDSVGHATAAAVRLLRGDVEHARRHIVAVHWRLLIPLGAGIVTSLAVGAAFIPALIEDYPQQMRGLFFGLIAGSIIIPWRRIDEHGIRTVAVLVVGMLIAFVFTGLPDRQVVDPSPVIIFAAASIAICAMILPGVSGAFLLLIMGMYERSLDAVHDRDLAYLAIFAAGAIVGLAAFSSVLRWLLARHGDITMAALVGLMAGSLRALWPYLDDDRALRAPAEGDPVLPVILLVAIGLALVVVLARLGDRTEADRPPESA